MTIEYAISKAELQGIRIRMAAAVPNLDAAKLHREVVKLDPSYDGVAGYAKVRRAYNGERSGEVPVSLLMMFEEILGASLKWLAGDPDAEPPIVVISRKDAFPRGVKLFPVGLPTQPAPELALVS